MSYQRLASVSDDVDNRTSRNLSEFVRPSSHLKSTLVRIVAVFVTMYLAVASLRSFRLPSWYSCHRNASLKAGLSTLPSHFELPSGDRIPSIALGVWKAGRGEVGAAVKAALKTGYRHIDDAWIYRNEEEVGQAVKESGVRRSDIWLTSKLWNSFHSPEDVEPALDESLKALGTDYLDLYLIHWPIAFKKEKGPDGENIYDPELSNNPYPTWQKLEEMAEKGKVKNIGLSNFNIRRIQILTANPLKVKPAVLQVELSFWNPQPDLVKWAKENDLPVEAYSPLGGNKQIKDTLREPTINKIANKLCMTPAQVVVSWHIQRGTVVLPKSVTSSRVIENLQVRVLPEDLFAELEAAASSHEPRRTVNPSKDWGLDFDVFED